MFKRTVHGSTERYVEAMKNTTEFKNGDIVGFTYAGPGPDVTYLVLTDVRETDATGFDLFAKFEIKSIKLTDIWKASEIGLETTIGSGKGGRIYSVRQLADDFLKGDHHG